MYRGIPASGGIAIGKAFVLPTWDWDVPEDELNVNDLSAEFERLYEGIRTSKDEILGMMEKISGVVGDDETNIFNAHLAILDDPVFMEEIQGIIRRQYKVAEVAVKEATEKFANMFDLLDDEYMKDRSIDIKDVGNRLIKHLLGAPEITLPEDNQPFILVAKEISPSQFVHMNPQHVKGILMMVGGRTSHSAIMARALGIPMIVGLDGKLDATLQTGDWIVMDGTDGTIYVNPEQSIVERYQSRQKAWDESQIELRKNIERPAETQDGESFQLQLNINSLKELEYVKQSGAAGIGLFRTEFLFMDRDAVPTEEEQYMTYRQAAEMLEGLPVVIRTLDSGGDKKLHFINYPQEDNPFLGYRAIRISLDHEEQFKIQLRAILRASAHGNVKIMYPMISSVEEVRKANDILEQAKRELAAENKPFNEKIEVGIMIEVPSAVMIADLLAQEVNFFSIGTNDLVQYMLAVDRLNEHIAHMYEPFHPAILRAIDIVAKAAQKYGIELSVCGELAGDARALPIWLGIGVRQLSMTQQSLLEVKDWILKTNSSEAKKIFARMMDCKTCDEVAQAIQGYQLQMERS